MYQRRSKANRIKTQPKNGPAYEKEFSVVVEFELEAERNFDGEMIEKWEVSAKVKKNRRGRRY